MRKNPEESVFKRVFEFKFLYPFQVTGSILSIDHSELMKLFQWVLGIIEVW